MLPFAARSQKNLSQGASLGFSGSANGPQRTRVRRPPQYIRLDERASTSITLLFFSLFPNQMSELFAAGACSPTHQRISARKVLWNVVLSCHLALNVLAVLKNWARGVRRMWTGEVASAVCASLKTELGTLFRSHKVIVRDAGPRRGRERWSAVFDTDGVEGKRT